MKDGKGGLNAKLAVDFLNYEEKKRKSDTTYAFFSGIVGFGEALSDTIIRAAGGVR